MRLVLDEGLSKAETSRRLGINQNSLGKWVRAYHDQHENAFPDKGRQRPEQEELKRLREENRQLRMEREILNDGLLGKGNTVRYRFIEAERANYPVRVLCRVLKVQRSGFYEWLKREIDINELLLMWLVVRIFEKNKKVYGARPISKALQALGWAVGRYRARSLMIKAQIELLKKRKFRITTDSKNGFPVSPNLLNRQFDVRETDTVWCGDITYLLTSEGWMYLAVATSRREKSSDGRSRNG